MAPTTTLRPWTGMVLLAATLLLPVRAPADESPALPDTVRAGIAHVDSLVAADQWSEAEAVARDLLSRVEASRGPRSLGVAAVIDSLIPALISAGRTRDDDTRDLAERAVAIRRTMLGDLHPTLEPSYLSLGYLLRVRGEYEPAADAYRQAMAVAVAAGDTATVEFARAIGGVGKVHHRRGRHREAAAAFRREIAVLERLEPVQEVSLAITTMNLGATLRVAGDLEAAESELVGALQRFQSLFPGDHKYKGNVYNNLGMVAKSRGDFRLAEERFREALRQKRAVLPPKHPQIGTALLNLGMIQSGLGRLQEAEDSFDAARAILEESLSPTHTHLASLHNNLGDLMLDRGRWSEALEHFELAADIHRASRGPRHPKVALALTKQSLIAAAAGDDAEALRLLSEVLQIREEALGADHDQVANTLVALARIHEQNRDWAAARDLLERARVIYDDRLSPDHPNVARAHMALAWLELSTEDLDQAEVHCQEALRILRSALGERHDQTADALVFLARIKAAQGDLAAARALTLTSLEIHTETLGPGNPAVASGTVDLALWSAAAGDSRAALDLALRADGLAVSHLRLMARGLTRDQALFYAEKRARGLDLALHLLDDPDLKNGDAASRVMDALVRSRATALDEACRQQRDLAGDDDPLVDDLKRQLAASREQLSSLTLRGPGRLGSDQYRELLAESRTTRDRAERELARHRADGEHVSTAPGAGLATIRRALPEQAALVSYVRYRGEPSITARWNDAVAGVDRYGAFVVSSRLQAPQFVPLGASADIDDTVRQWRGEMAKGGLPEGPLARRAEAAAQRAGAAVRRLAWDPLSPHLAGATVVFVVPDGSLNLVNLAALPDEDGRYLVEDTAVLHLLSAERDLQVAPVVAPPTSAGLLVVGGAEFDAVAVGASTGSWPGAPTTNAPLGRRRGDRMTCREFTDLSFTDLPGTLAEANAVAELWQRPGATSETATRLLGADATEAAVKRLAPEATDVHLATHGFVLGGDCPSVVGPLLRSGLAFTGANGRHLAASGHNDGILTAEELSSLDLRRARWVVLSACDTGVGDVANGEGVVGLRRALRTAGAGTVVMSLWPVDDQAALAWMQALYRARFTAGLPTAEAVKAANLDRLAALRAAGRSTHPASWAGFVAAGDWR